MLSVCLVCFFLFGGFSTFSRVYKTFYRPWNILEVFAVIFGVETGIFGLGLELQTVVNGERSTLPRHKGVEEDDDISPRSLQKSYPLQLSCRAFSVCRACGISAIIRGLKSSR